MVDLCILRWWSKDKLHESRVTCASAVIVRLCETGYIPRLVSPPPDVMHSFSLSHTVPSPGLWGSALATPLNTNTLHLWPVWGCRTWRQAPYCFHFPFSMRSLTLSMRGPAVTALPDDPECETRGHFQANWEGELKRIHNSSNVQCAILRDLEEKQQHQVVALSLYLLLLNLPVSYCGQPTKICILHPSMVIAWLISDVDMFIYIHTHTHTQMRKDQKETTLIVL